jgi:ferritin-like metal-binding protein YciE
MEARARELFMHGLKDIYDAEHRFAEGLRDMISAADDDTLVQSLRRHRQVTMGQIERLEKVFRMVDSRPRREKCKGAEGLVDEYKGFLKDKPDTETIDAFTPTAGLKVEHYEIASYRTLIEMAGVLGQGGAAALLGENLAEEEEAATEMEGMAVALGAKLAGVRPGNLVQRTVSVVSEGVREGAKLAVGAADVMRERATDMVERAETRGRRVSGNGKPRKTTGSRKRTGTRSSSTKRSTSSSRSGGRKTTARKSTGTSARRKTTTGRSTSRAGSRKTTGSRTTRRPASRKTTGSRTTRRPASRKTTGSRTTRRPASRRTTGSRTTRRPAAKKSTRRSR